MAEQNANIDYELITKYLAGEANADEKAEVMQWRKASERNTRAFSEMETLWQQAGTITPHEKAKVDVDQGWQKLRARIKDGDKPIENYGSGAKTRRLYYYFSRMAAVLIVGFGFYWLYEQFSQPSENVVIATANQVLNDTLPDGSTVALNANSQLSYTKEFGDQQRNVSLKGEGFFNVEHDAQKPFIVEANGATVTVLGTSFYVRAYDSLAQITIGVKDGTVRVTALQIEQILKAGESVTIDNASKKMKAIEPFDPNALFWESETLIFQNEKLETVFETLETYYDLEIIVENIEVLDCRLTAKFYGEDINQILEIISTNFNLLSIQEDNRYIISGSGCE